MFPVHAALNTDGKLLVSQSRLYMLLVKDSEQSEEFFAFVHNDL